MQLVCQDTKPQQFDKNNSYRDSLPKHYQDLFDSYHKNRNYSENVTVDLYKIRAIEYEIGAEKMINTWNDAISKLSSAGKSIDPIQVAKSLHKGALSKNPYLETDKNGRIRLALPVDASTKLIENGPNSTVKVPPTYLVDKAKIQEVASKIRTPEKDHIAYATALRVIKEAADPFSLNFYTEPLDITLNRLLKYSPLLFGQPAPFQDNGAPH